MRKRNNRIFRNGSLSLHACTPCRPAGRRMASFKNNWVPDADVYLTATGLVIQMELAGLGCQSLKLTAQGDRITISGRRSDNGRRTKRKFLSMEIKYGPFERDLDLPEGYDLTLAHAAYKNGFLRIDVPAMADL
jgi:HSP20 family protein